MPPEGLPSHGSVSRQPAKSWEQAFVTGNGRLGAMMFGDPINDTVVANHCRLFAALGNREIVPDLRKTIREKGYGAAMSFFLGKAREQGYPGISAGRNAFAGCLPGKGQGRFGKCTAELEGGQ